MAAKRRKKTKWDELSPPVKAAIWTGAGVVAFLGGRWVYREIKHGEIRERLKNRQQHQVTPSVNLSSSAFNIHDAFYNADIFGYTEDEDAAIREVLRVPKEHVPKLAEIYGNMFNEDLYGDFRRFLDTTEYARVRDHLETTTGMEDGFSSNANAGRVLLGAMLTLDGMSNNNLVEMMGGALLVAANMQPSQPSPGLTPVTVTPQLPPGGNIQTQPGTQPAPINVGGYTFNPSPG